jgi:hypothetical protein
MDGKATLKLSFYNKSPATFTEEYPWTGGDKQVFFRVSDYVELRVSSPLSLEPLKIGKLGNRAESLYTVGFPNPTSVFAKFGGVDSPGYDRWVSTGSLKESTIVENINISTDIASARGSSGSPLLKKNGEVVGILFSGASEDRAGTLLTDSLYLQVDFELMRRVWSQFTPDGKQPYLRIDS